MSVKPAVGALRPRRGWTVVELAAVLVITGLVVGALTAALATEQRAAREAAEIRATRAELRDAAAVLGRELRGAAPADTFHLASDSAVEFFAPILTAVTCAPAAGAQLPILPLPLRDGESAATITPDTGDLAWVWRADSLESPGLWLPSRIAGYGPATPSLDPCADDPGLVSNARVLMLAGDPGPTPFGAPVHIARRGRYSIYRASDGAWYLGYRRCDAIGPSRCQAVQPVAGPYRARTGGTSGLRFRYFDTAGTELLVSTATASVARIELTVRSDTANQARRAPSARGLDDSTALVVALRNAL